VGDRNKEEMNPLILAVDCEFSLETLKFLIEQGCFVDSTDHLGRTALHYAVDLENKEIIKFLMDNGADPDSKDYDDSSPLDEAALNEDLLKLL
jgi:ankyrin repeat protein